MYNMGGIYMYAIIIITSWKWVKYILELEDNRIWIKVHTVKYTQSTFTNVITKFSLREWWRQGWSLEAALALPLISL